MKKRAWIFSLVIIFAATFVFLFNCGAAAQKQKKKGDKKEQRNKDTEEAVEDSDTDDGNETAAEDKETEQKHKRGRAGRGGEKKGRASDARGESIKRYRPKALNTEQMREWKDGVPPGWSRGGKRGWRGSAASPGKSRKIGEEGLERGDFYPRGSENWNTEKRKEWKIKIENARERTRKRVRGSGRMTPEDEESAVLSIEEAAREGVPVEQAEKVVETAIGQGMKGEEIEKVTRAVSYGADKDVDYDELNSFIDDRVEAGERGDELALSIYEEIDKNQTKAEENKEVKRKSWWKRLFGKED